MLQLSCFIPVERLALLNTDLGRNDTSALYIFEEVKFENL